MHKFDELYSARSVITDIMHQDLIGPRKRDETISEPPIQYYIMGKLYPPSSGNLTNIDESRNASLASESDRYDASLASANMRNPSSMGITCTLKAGVKKVRVDVSFAVYEPIKDEQSEGSLNISDDKSNNRQEYIWKRREFHKTYLKDTTDFVEMPANILPGVTLKGFFHKAYGSNEKIFTAVLMNESSCGEDYTDINRKTLFQAHIRISAENQSDPIFTTVMRQVDLKENPELIEMDMLYDQYRFYGQGHGCSVLWGNHAGDETSEPEYVESSYMPKYNLRQMKPADNSSQLFRMHHIITASPSTVIHEIRAYVDTYQKWIQHISESSRALKPEYQRVAKKNIQECQKASERILRAADLLEQSINGDQVAWRSFVYANEAMLYQRVQSERRKRNSDGPAIDLDRFAWYPFQLAFILQELPSIIEPESYDRTLVDLLWFPTGGGKTEAYLGISAFTIFYRRLRDGDKGDGVAVFMRYTLRLLTMQQFERACTLICACELLRRKYKISKSPIEIGLWVGNETTPKDLSSAQQSLNKIKRGQRVNKSEADPRQLRVCPWCGSPLTADNYIIDTDEEKIHIRCPNEGCQFHKIGELPVRITDEEIYQYTPSFIVGTVDKFAQILFKEETYKIFGKGTNHNPPDLIIQDEMHLISGPLGTMTGIYEGAITKMCEHNNIPVKIIASTATIRNARSQVNSLYGRNFAQFPPQGIDADDSFFAKKANAEERPARLYVGVMGVGTTSVTTLIRVYASWLFASRYLISLQYKGKPYDDKTIDNFWTLTGYFNSLRELGSARTQIVDDVQSRYKYLKDSKFADVVPKFQGKESYTYSDELTSRKETEKLNQILQVGLNKSFTRTNYTDVYDFIVATNMISVGVDIDRLGVMVVTGQPKTNAEYIQATSRVGRHNPGLVITIYNAAKSRDRSHYEQFLRYHSAMYRYVESSSLTPFSDRARDRGLQALFVILCRFYIDELRPDDAAGNFDKENPKIKQIKDMISEYVKVVDESAVMDTDQELQEIIDVWDTKARGNKGLKYKVYYKKNGNGLLKDDTDIEDRFRAMNSMRSVEEQSGIYLL